MRNIVRKAITAMTASSLLLPFATTTASAQSSFGSSSFNFEMSQKGDSIEDQFESAFENYGINKGFQRVPSAEYRAELVLDRIIKGHILPRNGSYMQFETGNAGYTRARAIPDDDMQDFLNGTDRGQRIAKEYFSGTPFKFGVAVGLKGQVYYLVTTKLY